MVLVEENCTLSFESLPFLVVMSMTPLEARDPYMAVEAASFNTVIDSMSCGLIILRKLSAPEIPPSSKGTPSTTINGSLEALSEAPPRTRIVLPDVAEPEFDMI